MSPAVRASGQRDRQGTGRLLLGWREGEGRNGWERKEEEGHGCTGRLSGALRRWPRVRAVQ